MKRTICIALAVTTLILANIVGDGKIYALQQSEMRMTDPSSLDVYYLTSGRLADVLTLIQILAYDPSARRTDEALRKQLFRKPRSAETWVEVGKEHPEFFRVFDPQGRET